MTREEFAALALSFDGTSATDPESYLELIGPQETAEMRREMLTMSGCALTVRGLWRLAGLEHPRLEAPYKVGQAIADVVAIAREKGAWRAPDGEAMPSAGDVVFVGAGSHEHVFTLVAAEGGTCFVSVDGGQLVNGAQTIRQCSRELVLDGLKLWDHAHSVRQVNGWADFDALFGLGPAASSGHVPTRARGSPAPREPLRAPPLRAAPRERDHERQVRVVLDAKREAETPGRAPIALARGYGATVYAP